MYEAAGRECGVLKEVFGGECRIANLTVSSNLQARTGQPAETSATSATATYELTLGPSRP